MVLFRDGAEGGLGNPAELEPQAFASPFFHFFCINVTQFILYRNYQRQLKGMQRMNYLRKW